MFGRRTSMDTAEKPAADPATEDPPKAARAKPAAEVQASRAADEETRFYRLKREVFDALIDMIEITRLTQIDPKDARAEIGELAENILSAKAAAISGSEQSRMIASICDDLLGYGPLEPLLAREDVSDIMVNGTRRIFVETEGRTVETEHRFRDETHLMNVCQRIVGQVGRRVDESSPICDARLPDGSRVNVIAPPLSIDGATLTIRKFSKEGLSIDQLVKFGSVDPHGAEVLKILGRCRANVLISGGTGSGKTTLLNCLTRYVDHEERIVTCEDSAELQLQQPHVVRLETRPPNLEGSGEISMRQLVKNCLRMRPERIIVGEVRGPEAFDLLQAMNTGHDGSMGTLHANSPREAISRMEAMITMGGFGFPVTTIRQMIVSSVDVIVQASRLRDGSRRITHITEVIGMEGDVPVTQDIYVFDVEGEDSAGRILGRHRGTGIARPAFWDRARYYGEEQRLTDSLEAISEGV